MAAVAEGSASGRRSAIRRWHPSRRAIVLIWVVVWIVVAALPWLGISSYLERQIVLTAVLALLISGLNLTFGWSGELNLGVPAMYAAGAYVAGYLAANVINDVLVGVIAGAVAALVVGLVTGIPGLRLGGWMLAIASFFVVILIPSILQAIPSSVLGGNVGLLGIPQPQLFGIPLSSNAFFACALILTGLWFAVYRNLVKSRFGDTLVTMQQGQALLPSLGLSRYRLKLVTYAIGAIPAGIGGALLANLDRFVGPESFTLNLAIYVLAGSIFAGRKSIYPIFAAAALIQFINVQSAAFNEAGQLLFGLLLVVGGLAFAGGISGLFKRLLERFLPRADAETAEAADRAADVNFGMLQGKSLVVENVSKNFGGSVALDDVSFVARPGKITALIGPNGSGKTTMLNIVSGFYRVDSGTVRLDDVVVSSMNSARVARQGVARTFQTPQIAGGLTTAEVVASASVASSSVSLVSTIFRLPRYRRIRAAELAAADSILRSLGLERFSSQPASTLSLGTRRMTELARALASKPSVILLDEVASGLDRDEVVEMAHVLRAVSRAGAAVVLVEHNFALIRLLADSVVVLADGKVLTVGTPTEIESHPDVLRRFLGETVEYSGTSIDAPAGANSKKES
jgi:branched-chain amino acid transport system permease protein